MRSLPGVKLEGAFGTKTADGFVVTFPQVVPSDRKLHERDNNRALRNLILGRAGKHPSPDDPDPLVYRSRTKQYWSYEQQPGTVESLFYETLLTAYSPHHSVCLRPEVLWQLIVHEVGTYVQQNSDACAHLFTTKPDEKQKLEVTVFPDDSWEQIISRFRPQFDERIDARVLNAFLPKFSTTDQEAEVALLLTFMDTVSKWYEYLGAFACGFPKIRIAGTIEDWKLLVSSAKTLSDMFEGLSHYFADLVGVLQTIVTTLESGEVDPEFWGSMFRYRSDSGPAILDGWMSAFVAFRRVGNDNGGNIVSMLREPQQFQWRDQWQRGDTLQFEHIPKGLNYADFTLKMPNGEGDKFLLISGVLGSEYDEYLTPRLGLAVAKA